MGERAWATTVLYVHDGTKATRDSLTTLVVAVSKASANGMAVQVKSATAPNQSIGEPVPSVWVEGVRVEALTVDDIYLAIARAHRRPVERHAAGLPAAKLVRRGSR